ncbi:sulfite exporter TauE/SafE family protein [Desulfovibrio sp. OttesenSCG-928-A18]|nr:sulfite exporter TauE/SafE family protein [Desulfovibrio sp. OttesenSCG-928-A18]
MLTSIVIFLILGAFAGLLAGLLGVGGGLVIVPMINYAFALQGTTDVHTHHLALGTSLATIMFTSISSFMAHHRSKAVIWSIVKYITPGILLGTFFGSKVAAHLPTELLKGFFVVFLLYVGTQMLLNIKPKASREIPGFAGNSVAGGVIGMASSFVGIGGGTLSVPYMTWCNVPMHKAIGTSAAIGFPIAVAGALGYLVNGLAVPDLPQHTVGYIYLPALFGIAAASVFTAPLGARLAHRLPVTRLKKFFACLLFVMAAQMAWGLLG